MNFSGYTIKTWSTHTQRGTGAHQEVERNLTRDMDTDPALPRDVPGDPAAPGWVWDLFQWEQLWGQLTAWGRVSAQEIKDPLWDGGTKASQMVPRFARDV